jgi:hypothetical protein
MGAFQIRLQFSCESSVSQQSGGFRVNSHAISGLTACITNAERKTNGRRRLYMIEALYAYNRSETPKVFVSDFFELLRQTYPFHISDGLFERLSLGADRLQYERMA